MDYTRINDWIGPIDDMNIQVVVSCAEQLSRNEQSLHHRPKEISAKIRAEGVDPLSKVQAIMKEINDRLEASAAYGVGLTVQCIYHDDAVC